MRAEQPTKLCKSRWKIRVKVGAPLNRFKPPGNYCLPSQGGSFVAVLFVFLFCGVLAMTVQFASCYMYILWLKNRKLVKKRF